MSLYAIDPRTIDDWVWLETEAEGEMGLRSNMGGFLALIERGVSNPGGSDYEMDGRATAAATRALRIKRRLQDARSVYGIANAFDLARRAALDDVLGGFPAHVAELTPRADQARTRVRSKRPLSEWLARLAEKVALGTATRADQAVAADLRRAAETLLLELDLAYRGLRRARAA